MAALGAAGLGACAVLAACAPVQAGSAAIVGNQRITVSSLDTQVSNWEAAAKPYGSSLQITTATRARRGAFLADQVRNHGPGGRVERHLGHPGAVTGGAVLPLRRGLAGTGQQHVQLLIANGVPPQMFPQVGQWEAQQTAYGLKANGGKEPTSTAEQNAVTAAVNKAQCTAAKSLNIQVSPQFGRLDYTTAMFSVVPAADTLSRPAGHADAGVHRGSHPSVVLTVLLSSPRVAPGLLSWQAWSALRAADRVLAGSGGHPLIPALTAAEVVPVVVDVPSCRCRVACRVPVFCRRCLPLRALVTSCGSRRRARPRTRRCSACSPCRTRC